MGTASSAAAMKINNMRRCMTSSLVVGLGLSGPRRLTHMGAPKWPPSPHRSGHPGEAAVPLVYRDTHLEHRPAGYRAAYPVQRRRGRDEQGAIVVVSPREVRGVFRNREDLEEVRVGIEDVDAAGAAAV